MARLDVEALFDMMISPALHADALKRIEDGPEPVDHYLAFRSPQSGSSLFGVFVQGGDVERVRYILDNYNPDINHQDNAGQTPLIYTCRLRKAPMAMFLLERGAEVDLADNDDYTPLWYVVMECMTEESDLVPVFKKMVELGANPDHEVQPGLTPRLEAEAFPVTGLAEFLNSRD